MSNSIFTKIINREIPAHIIYEDDYTIAFLDIHGTATGHTLVVPKKQIEYVWDLSNEDFNKFMNTTRMIAKKLRERLNVVRVGLKIIGEDVPHAHVHLIPFNDIKEYNNSPDSSVEPNHEELAKIAQKLKIKESQ